MSRTSSETSGKIHAENGDIAVVIILLCSFVFAGKNATTGILKTSDE